MSRRPSVADSPPPTGDEAGDSRVGPRHSCVMKTGALLDVTRPGEGDVAFGSWTDAAMSVHGVISISRQPPAGIVFACPSSKYRDLPSASILWTCLSLPWASLSLPASRIFVYLLAAGACLSCRCTSLFPGAADHLAHMDLSRLHCGNRLNIAAQAQRSGIDAGREDAHG